MNRLTILQGDALTVLKTLPDESVHCCVTSPPYWGLRDYGVAGQLGLEKTPEEYVGKMVKVFREVKRVLRDDGVIFVNLGDSYARNGGMPGGGNRELMHMEGTQRRMTSVPDGSGLKEKDLVGIPWMLAFALRADGWWLRQDIIWHKPNPMPESVTDRCTKAHEYIFLLTKSARYFYDAEAIKTPPSEVYANDSRWDTGGTETNYKDGYAAAMAQNPKMPHRVFNGDKPSGINRRSVWTVPSNPCSEAHFATFPPDLIKPCILAGTSARGCCPKCGAPWERILERVKGTPESFNGSDFRNGKKALSASALADVGQCERTAETRTTGWHPGCDCRLSETVSCTVFDPFFGSGTTGMVALELGRKCIGIELNPAYIKLAEDRCNVTPGLALA